MGLFWEISLGDFLLVTIFLGGGAAYLTGRAVATTWRTIDQLLAYILALACIVRFVHYALFGGTLLSFQYLLVDLVVLAIASGLGYRITKTNQMVGQYYWLYDRASPVTWRERQKSA